MASMRRNMFYQNKKQETTELVAVVQVEAVAGDPVYLPCDISTKPDAHGQPDAVLLVLWYREDLGTPIYSVDARERDWKQAERWSDDHVFSNRAYFMPEKHPAELGVDHVRDSDAGLYRCRVDFKIAQTRNSKVNLTVVVPPHKIVIVDENGVEKNNFVGPYEEGAELRLLCQVFGGKPKPSVVWYRGDDMLSNYSVVAPESSGGYVQNQLVLHNLGRQDLRSQLTCHAANNNRTIPLTATVHVDMNFKPLDVRILASSQPLSAGRRYDLLCQSTGSRPPAKITWWKNGHRLDRTKETTSNDGNTTTSTLSFVATKEDDGKNLTCKAENPVISSETLYDYWTLHIHYIPETKLTLGKNLNPDAIREGADVYFDCMVQAEPGVYKVEWRHNGKLLNHNVAQGIIISNQSLVLQGVSRQSAGNYVCVGFNTEGDGDSNPFYLNVLYAPSCRQNQTRVHGVAKQEKANISCEVDSNPPEVTFRWTFNNSAESMEVATSRIERHGTSSLVTYTPATELDYGTLLCWATNRIGHQRIPCVYHIIAAGRPDQVHNCTVANTSMSSFSLRCAEGFNGGLPQFFLVEVRESASHELRANLSSPVPLFSVHGLLPGQLYLASVYSANVKGKSEPVIVQAATLRLPEKQLTAERGKFNERPRQGFRLTPVMTVVIGVVGSLFVVACVVAGLLRLQCSRNEGRRKRHKMEAGGGVGAGTGGGGGGGHRSGATPEKPAGGPPGGGGPTASPLTKPEQHRHMAPGAVDTDERNPDIIPQPSSGMEEDEHDYLRKRQLVSTIETRTSPSRSLLQHATGPYPGYCTLRNGGLPLQDLSNIPTKPQQMGDSMYPSGGCTLPRQWAIAGPPVQRGAGVLGPGAGGYQALHHHHQPPPPVRAQPPPQEAAPETPLMHNKRESTV